MKETFLTDQLPNGLTLLGQHMDDVSSAAMAMVVHAGAAHDASGAEGSAAVGCEWCLRGAGDKDTRQLNEALDSLGCQHHESIRSEHIVFSAAQLGRNLPEILKVYSDILLRPQLHDDTFEPCRALTMQDLASLEDEPARKAVTLLREKFYPSPLGRCVYGSAESLAEIAPDDVRKHIAGGFSPAGAILVAAGNIEWDSFRSLAAELFGGWTGQSAADHELTAPEGGVTHIPKDSAQTHIALAHRAVTIGDPHYYAARMAEMVLSGGMSSRLFTEVREKRGLVYHVSSRYHSLHDHAGMFTYAGTTPEKAQETFDVTVGELKRLAEGIQPEELATARTKLKSALIMQSESTESRAGSLASDWYHLRKLRSLQEISDAADNVTADDIMEYLAEYPADNFTVLTIGPEPVDTGRMND